MQSETSLQGSLSVERMCQLGQVSRAGFYRYFQARAPIEESMTMRSAIQEIALQHRLRYGYRRITAELGQRGMKVNHKRVARMMRDDNLLTIRHRELLYATDRGNELEIYLNPGKAPEDWRYKPGVVCGHYLRPAQDRVRVSGGGARCLLS
ncbi:MAG: hypothetical protein DMG50_29735, partial [Acidobacteria bacterium]